MVLFVMLAGGLGAVSRFVVDGVARRRSARAYPWSTWLVNVTGSFALGVLTGLVLASAAPESVRLLVGTGFLGGYTTFSTASVEAVRLAQSGRMRTAVVYAVATVVSTVGVAALGLALGLLRLRG